ncbi:hypothetical protein AB0H82_34660 [Streptomyces sp. NPDC050732]|uniref:hypothetical protein n=1 Tax=Streptomyces sp. NPDC050732 TaxID=3154632 RepID=UPI00341DF5C1
MRTLKRSPSTTVVLAALIGNDALATAAPASAAGYHCKTSTRSVHAAAYQGFWAEDDSGYGRRQFATPSVV